MATTAEPLINPNPQLQAYYQSLESRVGYRLFLGGTRHFGYYERDTYWPFPVSGALRAMEDKMGESLGLPPGSRVLDAGCGVGHVALHMAKKFGFRMLGIDVVEGHLMKARRNFALSGLPAGQVEARKMDYHHLESLEDQSFQGVYTMETLVHATNPAAVLAGFHRILVPGGRITLFEYDHEFRDGARPDEMARSLRKINEVAAMPTNARSHPGVFEALLEGAGFTDLVVHDYSENIVPMTRFFCAVAYIPWLIVTLLGLELYFINTVTAVQSYRGRKHWRYVTISASKPAGQPTKPPATE